MIACGAVDTAVTVASEVISMHEPTGVVTRRETVVRTAAIPRSDRGAVCRRDARGGRLRGESGPARDALLRSATHQARALLSTLATHRLMRRRSMQGDPLLHPRMRNAREPWNGPGGAPPGWYLSASDRIEREL
jgi:hypothetical protein